MGLGCGRTAEDAVMRKEKYAPAIARDLCALAGLYAIVAVMMARRLMHIEHPQAAVYGPFEIARPREMREPEEVEA